LGIATMLLVSGLATMGVESILAPPSPKTAAGRSVGPAPAVRQSLAPTGAPAQTKAAEKAK
jgi:hypothetical protein